MISQPDLATNQPTTVPVSPHFVKAGEDPYADITWEKRDAVITAVTGEEVFRQNQVEFPSFWSETASNITSSKYFRVIDGVREHSVRDMVNRVAGTIAAWGEEDGYFLPEGNEVFYRELSHILLNQIASFNSPVWFNIGVPNTPQQASACYIVAVEDSMPAILEWYRQEGMIFSRGSGSGVNVSNLRARGEPISKGGVSSGPLSFMRAADASAFSIKSGGTCLAPWQCIYTERGPVAVEALAQKEDGFYVVSYDPPTSRFKVKRAWAWLSGQKPVYRIKTDKGQFDLSYDHPIRLSTGEAIQASALKPGMSLHKCSIDSNGGYVRVHLQNGKKGKRRFQHMLLEDVYGLNLTGKVVHHANGDIYDNSPENLVVTTQGKHARLHMMQQVRRGEHVFQLHSFPKHGTDNPMHKDAPFWQDSEKVEAYKAKQGSILRDSGRAQAMQKEAARARMLHMGWRIINAGGSIDTFDAYVQGRKHHATLAGMSKAQLLKRIEYYFGTYAGFVQAVGAENHRVVEVQRLGVFEVYDVEVECPTADDKTAMSGHNFVVWPDAEMFGSGIVVFNTRRSARMVVMDMDHPDIEAFIVAKAIEEKKARVLAQAGYDDSLDGEIYATVAHQNCNMSVSASDEFLTQVAQGGVWYTRNRTDGATQAHSARDLMRAIAEAAWDCGDPGMHFNTTMNHWHTCPQSGRIEASNPCSEYIFLNDTACNLSSINLLKFLGADGVFDTDAFCHTVDIMLLAMEILVSRSEYPTAAITQNSEDYRTLGLGYANLGALLMAKGLPYDSDEGRDLAAAVTALMTGRAYQRSADIAKIKGAFTGYYVNREPMLQVIDQHIDALKTGYEALEDTFPIWQEAGLAWDRAREMGRQYGFRNAQVSLLAPTGTISFMMDCCTTGVEPDVALVSYKKLVGGGTLKHVNDQVPRALAALNYPLWGIEMIRKRLESGHDPDDIGEILGEHRAVFDCAFPSVPGGRSIAWQGHVKMVAALQLFLSGAISKTINLPADSTVQDVAEAFLLAWKLGCKSIAIYRDGCKHTQVLTTQADPPEAVLSPPVPPPKRRRLPDERQAFTHKFSIGGVHEGYLTVGLYEDGAPGEIFLKMAKEGSTLSGFADGFAIMVSVALQYGVPLHTLIEKFSYTRFEPSGWTAHADIKYANSILDYVFRYLGQKFLTPVATNAVPDPTQDVSAPISRQDAPGSHFDSRGGVGVGSPLDDALASWQVSDTVCGHCGALMLRSGACHVCNRCGNSSGCSG